MPETRTLARAAPEPPTVAAPATPPAPAADGRNGHPTLDERYELEEQLGVGATATVWRARDRHADRQVAIKVLHPHLLGDPVARQRMRDEADSAARLSHPGLLAVLGTDFSDEQAAVVFPYVDGESLARRLGWADTNLDPREAASVAAQVAEVLAYAHRSGVVHRDVKPSNILLARDDRVRLLDFGISATAASVSTDLTGTGMAIGTLPYMSPEQLRGAATGPESDVYSLGVVLYEMLAGRRPHAATTPLALAEEQQKPISPLDGVPTPLGRLALAALAFDAAARPSAADFAEAARAWLDGRPDPAAATVVIPAAVGATAALPVPAARSSTLPVPAARSSRRPGSPVLVAALAGALGLAVIAAFAFGPDWSAMVALPSATPAPTETIEATPPATEPPAATEPPPERAAPAPAPDKKKTEPPDKKKTEPTKTKEPQPTKKPKPTSKPKK